MITYDRYPPGPGYHGYPAPPPTGLEDDLVREPVEEDDVPIGGGASVPFQRSQSLGNRLIDTPPDTIGFNVKDLIGKEEDSSEMNEEEEVKSKENVSETELMRQRRLKRFHSVPVSPSSIKEEDDNEKLTS